MSQKKQLLHEVLQEDQEPFHLKNYIQDRSCRQPKPKPYPIHLNKQNPTRKNTCFFARTSSPANSPAALSPRRASPGNGAVFLHVPAKTASLLLEAALRIQKQSGKHASRPKPGSLARFGLFGSLLKRLTQKNSKKVNGVITSSPPLTSTVCLEIVRDVIGDNVVLEFDNGNNYSLERKNDGQLCEGPFRFALSRSPPSPESRTPEFSSPANSPPRRDTEDQENSNVGGSLKFQVHEEKYEEEKDAEEEKEQCSPVSILDPPFEDEDEDGPCDDDHTEEDDGFDLECSYANVQRAKKQLLRKLRKFEQLAGLDPVELERRMMDQDDPHSEDYDVSGSEDEAECGEGMASPDKLQVRKVPREMKRLVSEVVDEEETDASFYANGELMTKRVCKRFESWKDVECNTIDMMVEMDVKGDLDQWKRCREQVEDAVLQIELGIFGLLMEELTEELVVLTEIQ